MPNIGTAHPSSFFRSGLRAASHYAQREVARRLSSAEERQRLVRQGSRAFQRLQDAYEEVTRKVPQTKETKAMPRIVKGSINPINALSNRAAVKKKGKKVKVKARRSVKVSKGLREKVKKVIAGTDAYGEYHTRQGAAVGYISTGVAGVGQSITTAVSRDANYVIAYWPGPNIIAGSKVWFGGLCNNTAGTIQPDGVGSSFIYFSPAKILNAASVLWNQKAVNQDWSIPTDNFSLVTPLATATPQTGSSSFPQTGSLQIRVVNSYAKWRIKNINQRTVTMKIYHCVSKLKFQDVAPLTAMTNNPGLYDTPNPGATRNEITSGVIPLNGTIPSNVVCHPGFEPKKLSQFNTCYKYDVTEIVLKPGEECIHTIQGPKNYTLDYSKLYPDGASEVGTFFKDTTKCCMLSVELDAVFVGEGPNEDAGQWAFKDATAGSGNRLINPISIEVDEVYKLSCPKNAGFIARALAAGSIQTLNLKSNRYMYNNFNSAYNTAQTYSSFNEENPAAPIAESNIN